VPKCLCASVSLLFFCPFVPYFWSLVSSYLCFQVALSLSLGLVYLGFIFAFCAHVVDTLLSLVLLEVAGTKKKKVKKGDTLVALALKFGVSVNQIFFWNPHLVPLPDLGGKVSLARTHARTHARMNAVMRTHALARARARLLLRLNHLV
jgi:hypothetical protein